MPGTGCLTRGPQPRAPVSHGFWLAQLAPRPAQGQGQQPDSHADQPDTHADPRPF